jgi:acetyl-CoA C-acetyltransferase
MRNAFIVSAVRVPTGKFLGTLKDFAAPELGAMVVREAVARAGIDPAIVDECIMGNVVSGGVGQAAARRRLRAASRITSARSPSTRCADQA